MQKKRNTCLRIEVSLYDSTQEEARETGLTFTDIVEIALREHHERRVHCKTHCNLHCTQENEKTKEKKQKKVEEKENNTTTTTRVRARDDFDFESAVASYQKFKGYTDEEVRTWKEFVTSNDGRFRKTGEIIHEKNFRPSLDCHVNKIRKEKEREKALAIAKQPVRDIWGNTEEYYQMAAKLLGITVDQAKNKQFT